LALGAPRLSPDAEVVALPAEQLVELGPLGCAIVALAVDDSRERGVVVVEEVVATVVVLVVIALDERQAPQLGGVLEVCTEDAREVGVRLGLELHVCTGKGDW